MSGEEAFERGLEFYRQKGHLQAIKCFEKTLENKKFVERGKAWFLMGAAYDSLGEFEKAIECLEKSLGDENFDKNIVWSFMGTIYDSLGEFEKAIDCFEKALEDKKFERPSLVWVSMATTYYKRGEFKKAINCFEKTLEDEEFATPSVVWSNMGSAYYSLDKHGEAINCFEKAIQYDPNNANAYNNLGEVFLKLSKYNDAEEQFRKAIQIKPNLAEPHYNLGIILANEKYYEDAKKEYAIALEFEPTNADYLNSLGYILVELGQHEKAKENFENAICFDPTHSKAHHNLRELKKISETKYSSLEYLLVKLRKYIEKAISSETKYRMQSLFRYGFILLIIYMIYDTRKLLNLDKLSGTEFVALIVFLISLLTVMILFPKFKYIKASLSGFECLVDTEGKMMEPEPVMGELPTKLLI